MLMAVNIGLDDRDFGDGIACARRRRPAARAPARRLGAGDDGVFAAIVAALLVVFRDQVLSDLDACAGRAAEVGGQLLPSPCRPTSRWGSAWRSRASCARRAMRAGRCM